MTSKDEQSLKGRLCLVCGDVANGVHYNVLSCEGCKSFFLRSIKSETIFKCNQSGNCSMDLYTRRHCPACRLAKCRDLGMTESKVWDQSRLNTRKPLVRKVGKNRKEEPPEIEKPTDAQTKLVELLEEAYKMSKKICREYLERAPSGKNVEKHIYEPGTSKDLMNGNVNTEKSEIEICQELRKYAMDTFAIVVRQTIGFSRKIPGFSQLESHDQAVLVRASVIESMLLRLSEFFVIAENKIVNDLGDTYDLRMMSSLGLPTFSESSFKFLKQIKSLNLTTAEYSLMNAAAVLAPDRDELINTQLVEDIQFEIILSLQAITKVNHPEKPTLFADLINKLALMREISQMHQQDIMKMKLLQQDFTPLVAELFNVH
ncbi:bile acid receptor-like [Antedon mediterranea]|uniref:bile acid receptor-like n=1 Tax=Antedon mediterranea TaxID=105859 RepID=UPI003AF9EC92